MANVDVSRSIQFVSLDTHPANNALVVTYEILVSVVDRDRQRELARRNKRDQFQIKISALDNDGDLASIGGHKATEATDYLTRINLHELSSEIVRKCPLLHSELNNNKLEDIQLHLLYLIGRRRAQLVSLDTAQDRQDVSSANSTRPSSVASVRIRSAQQQSKAFRRSSRQQNTSSARARVDTVDLNNHNNDVYYCNYAKWSAATDSECDNDSLFEHHIDQFDEHLEAIESTIEPDVTNSLIKPNQINNSIDDLEVHLEGLYGSNNEKLLSMSFIRQLCKKDENLIAISSNRLLVSAMLRTLRDCSSAKTNQHLCESILYCLTRITYYQDIYERLSYIQGGADSIDLIKVIVDQLSERVQSVLKSSHQELKFVLDQYYYISSLLILILLRLNNRDSTTVPQQHGKQLAAALVDLLQVCVKHLSRDLRLSNRTPERMTSLLNTLIVLLQHLSVFKEFIDQLRQQQATVVESIVMILNILQLSRPGSGGAASSTTTATNELSVVSDKQTLNELYDLELKLIRLINNLMLDHRLKIKLIKKNLLKCVLRNLVVFLASRKSNTLSPFHRSPVLMVPFKSLYELSCLDSIKCDLYKSKIIMKCLLEYLLSITMDLKPSLDSLVASGKANETSQPTKVAATKRASKDNNTNEALDQIVLEPDSVGQYIVGVWINLSAKSRSAIYGDDADLRALTLEYIEFLVTNLKFYVSKIVANKHYRASLKTQQLDGLHLVMYLHLKLMRNFTQFLQLKEPLLSMMAEAYSRWVEILGESANELIATRDILTPLSVECLAILANLVSATGSIAGFNVAGDDGENQQWLTHIPVNSLFERLFLLNHDFDTENDDLLLVSIILLGTLARHREICSYSGSLPLTASGGRDTSTINSKIIEASNLILDSKSTDHEMTIGSLYTLSQLMNHCAFLREISLSLSTLTSTLSAEELPVESTIVLTRQASGQQQVSAVERLLDRLCELMLHGSTRVVNRLSTLLVNRFRQLEEQSSLMESAIYRKRFVVYNSKWLQAIRASREVNLASGRDSSQVARSDYYQLRGSQAECSSHHQVGDQADDNDYNNWYQTEDDQYISDDYEHADDDEQPLGAHLNHLRAFDDDDNYSRQEAVDSSGGRRQITSPDRNSGGETDEISSSDGSLNAPDLNVIDANSMIKHLTSRREFRSGWPQRQ